MKPGLKSLRTSLLVLLAAIFLPLTGVAVSLVVLQWQQQRDRGLAQLQERARELRSAMDRELTLDVAVLNTLGESSELDRKDWALLHAVAKRTATVRQGSWIILVDSNGQNLLNSAVPLTTKLPNLRESLKTPGTVDWKGRPLPLPSLAIFEEPLVTGKPAFSDLVYGRLSKQPVVATNVPVMRNGQGVYVLGMAYSPEFYSGVARSQLPSPDHLAAIVDSNGLVLARSRAAAEFLGRRSPPPFDKDIGLLPHEGQGEATSLEGKDSYFAYSRSGVAGWVAIVALPKSVLLSPAWRNLGLSLGVLAVLVLIAATMAHRLWTRIAIPLTQLADSALNDAPSANTMPLSGIQEVEALRAALIAAREAQQMRRRSEQEREQALSDLEVANTLLKHADLRKNEFLAMLGHELRNPLAAIGSAAALLGRQRHREQLPAGMQEVLERQIRHLARLVDDLLDVARITHGKLSVNLHTLRLDLLLERIAADMAPRFEARQQQFVVNIEPDILVRGDEVRLTQVIKNLLDNAGKYTPECGRIVLTLMQETAPSTNKEEEAAGRAAHACICVSDDGMGIGPELLQTLFQPFTQGVQGIARPQGGLGLGLAIAREVVLLHGGVIDARSDGENRGLVVWVRLPVVPAFVVDAVANYSVNGRSLTPP